ncbi:MAG: hypothetical protein Q4G64_10450, partial [bacterium]|nr:hypothetical protein [bacterium]
MVEPTAPSEPSGDAETFEAAGTGESSQVAPPPAPEDWSFSLPVTMDEAEFAVDTCQDGDLWACDTITHWVYGGTGTAAIAESCGGTASESGRNCSTDDPMTVGDSPFLDRLYEQCEAGDNRVCDVLYQ